MGGIFSLEREWARLSENPTLDPEVGGGVGGTCKVTKNQTQHSPSCDVDHLYGVGLPEVGRIWVLIVERKKNKFSSTQQCRLRVEDIMGFCSLENQHAYSSHHPQRPLCR
ncbi:hypothetical protein Lal_00041686 [Lupinus albus]|nr:hypothetical protein Lal_00041686 [Lupinus albus]